ncbi:sensor histidine kinase [Syntrophobotulus glycolicus]|uniref:sensor histidine kinase n=1 Tax=Syntrophobotulus glycolicus TaxID=51197 RepID=UPI001FA7D886|nr:sensor histidine kinase [Syntrophobotulus glycolicus]
MGTTRQDTEVWENNITCYAAPQDGQMDIILHSAQFYHAKRGASLAQLSLVKTGPAVQPGLSAQSKGFLVMGALLCAALFLLCIFLLQPGSRATLWFALACLAMVLREGLQSQAWTYFSFIPGRLSFMLEYLSVVLLTVFLSLYLGQYINGRFLRAVQAAAITGSGIYGLVLLLTGPVFYTSVLKYYQALLVGCIVGGVTGLFWQMRRPAGEQAAALYGIAVFYLAAVGDILMYSNLFGGTHLNVPVSEAAMLIFVLAQTVSLFLMNNRVLAEARAAEQKLALEKEVLAGLNRMKTEFLGNVSHELKTPLTVVSSHSQHAASSLPQRPELAEAARSLRLIEGEAARMALMVSQLLDVSRIDESRMVMEKKRESALEIIQAALDDYYPVFSKNHNTLKLKKEGNIPPVLCDRSRIIQVLVNLLTNAVRHTRDGEITVTVRGGEGEAAVTVADTGEGIPPESLARLFERYHSRPSGMEKARAGGDTGTGLGLYICKYIIEAHGGEISVESAPGRGTRVRFTLPADDAP